MNYFYSFNKFLHLIFFISFIILSCTTSGPAGLFGKKSAHDQYADYIKNADLQETSLGKMWFAAAKQSLASPLSVNLPYSETGYFPAEKPNAIGLLFHGKRGEKLNINLSKKPATEFEIYLDLWKPAIAPDTNPKFLVSSATTSSTITYDIDKDGSYILRLQPELLKGGEYTLTISTGPSLAFPVAPKAKISIGSFWGAARDMGVRKHEGIDIFAPRGTPLLAAADGVVGEVTENKLGGKVIFLRPDNKNYTLYYAHLDRQLVQPGQSVKTGDTIGLVGNTGNAITTVPHLHFGIYTYTGAIDPLPFVKTLNNLPAKITASLTNLNNWVRSNQVIKLYPVPSVSTPLFVTVKKDALLRAEAATAGWYRISMPDGQKGFVQDLNVSAVSTPISYVNLKSEQPLLDEPNIYAAKKTILVQGQPVSILAQYKDFYYVKDKRAEEGWVPKKVL